MKVLDFEKLSVNKLNELLNKKETFVITENKHNGTEYALVEDFPKGDLSLADCKFLASIISDKCEFLEEVHCDNGLILLCDEDGLYHKLERNDYASYLYGDNIVGTVIVCFE